jgi:hypothetical protein
MPGKEAEWYTLADEGLVDVEAPNVEKFARSKRIENICAELAKLGVEQKHLDPILAEVRPF